MSLEDTLPPLLFTFYNQ